MTSLALTFLALGILFKLFPPKKINLMYGYRTTRSMKNIESWKVANSYAAQLMIIIFLFIAPIIYLLDNYTTNDYGIIDILLFGVAFLLIYILTERKLKTTFKA